MELSGAHRGPVYDLTGNKVGNLGSAALVSLLTNMSTLKTLNMGYMSSEFEVSRSQWVASDIITTQGWQAFFTSLQDSNLDLENLYLCRNNIDNEGIALLVRLLSNMNSLKSLGLGGNRLVTPAGWQSLTEFMQRPNFALEELDLDGDHARNVSSINDDTLVAFACALVKNKSLKQLLVCQRFAQVTKRGWKAVSTLLCNKTSIMDTYNSSHVLQELGRYSKPHRRLVPLLELNKNEDKAEVARQKILQTHFSTKDSSKMEELLDMEFEVLPAVIAWIGRPTHARWEGRNVSGLSLMYNLMRRLPDLFDSSAQKKSSSRKRKRVDVSGLSLLYSLLPRVPEQFKTNGKKKRHD